MSRRYETLESIRIRKSMASQISGKDPRFKWYSGADYHTADTMAFIDFCLFVNIIPRDMITLTKLYRLWLEYHKIAVFMSYATEITKLGAMLGRRTKPIDFSSGT